MIEHRSLLLRSNRFLGSTLVNKNLIRVEDLEMANQKLLEIIQSENLKQASILNILLFDLKALEENDLIFYMLEEVGIGLVDLNNYDLVKSVPDDVDLDVCWATWTVPFDSVDGFHFLATSYYLSAPSKKFWEDKLGGNPIWYVASVDSISQALTRLDDRAVEQQAEEA